MINENGGTTSASQIAALVDSSGNGPSEEVQILPPARQVTNADSMDLELFDSLHEKNRYVRALTEGHEEEAFPDLLRDGFASFYKHAPEILDEVPRSRELNKKLIGEMMQLSEYQQLRQFTVGDEVSSLASLGAIKKIFEMIPAEAKQQQEQLAQEEKRLEELLSDVDFTSESGKETIQEQVDQMNVMSDAHQQTLEQVEDEIRQAVRAAMTAAADESAAEQQAAIALGWGSESGDLSHMPMGDRLELAKQLKSLEWVQKLAKLAGRFIHIAERKQAQKISYERAELDGVEEGDNLADVLPEEFVKFLDPDLEAMFFLQMFERRLQQYRLTAGENKGKGPIAVAIDCSTSMRGYPDMWAKAVALALFAIARKQNRHFSGCLFNAQVVKSIDVPKGEAISLEQFSDFFGAAVSGGTKFEPPLNAYVEGLESCEGDQHPSQESDLIFITDGICNFTAGFLPIFLERKTHFAFNVYSVLIGSRASSLAVLESFSDKVFTLSGDPEANQEQLFDAAFTI